MTIISCFRLFHYAYLSKINSKLCDSNNLTYFEFYLTKCFISKAIYKLNLNS